MSKKNKEQTPNQVIQGAKRDFTAAAGRYKAAQDAAWECAKASAAGKATVQFRKAFAALAKKAGWTPADMDAWEKAPDGAPGAVQQHEIARLAGMYLAFEEEGTKKDPANPDEEIVIYAITYTANKNAPGKRAADAIRWARNLTGKALAKSQDIYTTKVDTLSEEIEKKMEEKETGKGDANKADAPAPGAAVEEVK